MLLMLRLYFPKDLLMCFVPLCYQAVCMRLLYWKDQYAKQPNFLCLQYAF